MHWKTCKIEPSYRIANISQAKGLNETMKHYKGCVKLRIKTYP